MPTIKGVRQASDQQGVIELASEKVICRYSLEFVLLADNESQGPITIRSTAGLPLVGYSTYNYNGESDTTAVCKRKTPRRDPKSRRVWYVLCDFDNDPNSQSQEDETNQAGAVNRPPIREWSAEYGEEVLHKDYSSPTRKAIVNPCGQPFDPPVTRRVIYPVLQVKRYVAVFDPSKILAYTDHRNKSPFYGADPGHAVMAEIRAIEVIEDGQKLWEESYRIRFAVQEDGHKLTPLNQGTHYKETAAATTLKAFIEDGVPYIGNLNADGTKAASGTRTYSEFEQFPEAEFDELAL